VFNSYLFYLTYDFSFLLGLKVCFGTSSQMPVSSDDHKRTKSLLQQKDETVIDIADKWNNKHIVPGSIAELDT
jgi:hypothetical protein